MDGATLLYQVRQLLSEASTSSWMDNRTTYDYIYEAAFDFVKGTGCLTANQTITTTANTTAYDLNPDFMRLYMRTDDNELFVKYDAGNNAIYWPTYRDYDATISANNTDTSSTPNTFTIRDKRTAETRLTGNASDNGTASAGECVLKDTTLSQFVNVKVGDHVHNQNDSSSGVVVATSNNTTVYTSLFGGTNNAWAKNDTYYIIPRSRKQILLDPPSSTAGHNLTIEYIQIPDPVYSDYRSYRIPFQYMSAIVQYAAWKLKYRDMQPNFGDAWYKHWDYTLGSAANLEGSIKNRYKWKVNFIKRSLRDRSYR